MKRDHDEDGSIFFCQFRQSVSGLRSPRESTYFKSSRLLSMRNFERQANRNVANRSKQGEEEGTRREKRRSNKRGESDRSNHRQI